MKLHRVALVVAGSILLTAALWAADSRTVLKPGWNMFSPQQDIEVGQQVSPDAERQLQMLNDSRVDEYVDMLGQRLVARAQGEEYPYRFQVVDDRAINAFALPGGPVYINRGVVEAADDESQLAGVIAHEISHIALRHGTNQATKAAAAQMPLAILGGLLGSDSTKAMLAQFGASFALNSVLLKYSRTAESEADILGTQILYDAGYDPRAMGQFFQKLEAEQASRGQVEFFSNHPSPDHRIDRVTEEVTALGGARRGAVTNSRQFDQNKRYVLSLPEPPEQQVARAGNGTGDVVARPDAPAKRFVSGGNSLLQIRYPENWRVYGQGDAMTIAPQRGLVDDGRGNQAMAYGLIVNVFDPRPDGYGRQLQGSGYEGRSTADAATRLDDATDRLIEQLQSSNRSMRLIRPSDAIRVDGDRALSSHLSNDSPLGGREANWLITVEHPDGVLFLVFTAPERDVQRYQGAFDEMLRSVRINGR